MSHTSDELLALFGVIAIGLLLGRIQVRGVSLGTSGVVFAALFAGHLGFRVPQLAGMMGIVLFVYCLGLGAGPSFVQMFMRRGKALALVAVAMIASAGVVAILSARLLHLGPDLTCGLFAGALTSTPALAAASERLAADSEVAVGFGIAYPFGVVGVILFVQLMPKILGSVTTNTNSSTSADEKAHEIDRVLIHVLNPMVEGKRLHEVVTLSHAHCQISRSLVENRLEPIRSEFRLQHGQRLLAVGPHDRIAEAVEVLGERCDDADYVLDVETQRRHVVVTSKALIGKTLRDLQLLERFGVTISRITRNEVQFVPGSMDQIHFGDELWVVGDIDKLRLFIDFAGHRERTLDETDLISLAVGLMAGVLLGRIEFGVAEQSYSLGMAGGPLVMGLILGHAGQIGPVASRMPRAARLLLADVGLAFFLAQAGSQAGSQFVAVLELHGLALCGAAISIVTVPLLVGMVLSRWGLRLDLPEACGGICGAMTSTPGLGAAMAAHDSSLPAASYATVYPLALVVITIVAPLLIAQIS